MLVRRHLSWEPLGLVSTVRGVVTMTPCLDPQVTHPHRIGSCSALCSLQVVLAANTLPAINDITAAELRIVIDTAAKADPIIKVRLMLTPVIIS